MASASTEITTPKASMYLQQLCKHLSHKFAVEFTPERGTIPFAEGRQCRLEAAGDVLKLTVETDDPEVLTRLESVVIEHLKRFAHREDLGAAVWRAD
jgi:uncharacterized protein